MSNPFGFDGLAPELVERISATLGKVEARLLEATSSADPFIEMTASHLSRAGGKRFRPFTMM